MESLPENIAQRFQGKGIRFTKLRKFLICTFTKAAGPLSVGELRQAIERGKLSANKSSVYREISFLLEHHLVREVDFLDGMKRYEFLRHDDKHHHHMVCTNCRTVECVDVCFNAAHVLRQVRAHSKFLVQNHVLEFFGLCERCQAKKT